MHTDNSIGSKGKFSTAILHLLMFQVNILHRLRVTVMAEMPKGDTCVLRFSMFRLTYNMIFFASNKYNRTPNRIPHLLPFLRMNYFLFFNLLLLHYYASKAVASVSCPTPVIRLFFYYNLIAE